MNDAKFNETIAVGDEAMCAFFVENPFALRRVVAMMPHGNPAPDFLKKIYLFASLRNRKVDLANSLLGYDGGAYDGLQSVGDCDWFRGCMLPSVCPLFFFQVERYACIKHELESGTYEDDAIDEVDAVLDWIEDVKNDIGDGIVGMEKVLMQIQKKREAILQEESVSSQ